jgi:ADP-glucose pyrophosphorylase
MIDATIISYPGHKENSLLSLGESRSRYMLPLGGKFRVIDFTLRNSISCEAKNTIIFSGMEDGLIEYVKGYSSEDEDKPDPIRIVNSEHPDLMTAQTLIAETMTPYYIFYNGDNASIIDFKELFSHYMAKKSGAVIFGLDIDGKASMAHKILVTDKKTLMGAIKKSKKEAEHSPDIFEMIINRLMIDGIKKAHFKAEYFPVKTVPDYYNLNRKIIWDERIFNLLFMEKIIKSQITSTGFAHIKQGAKIISSFISDYCTINGTVENSIIFPGVTIEEGSVIKDSIILPFVNIGSGVRITKTIVDESTNKTAINPQIDNFSKIGSSELYIKNSDFPKALFDSITLIGKNCKIPSGSSIGGACYVASNLGEEFFIQKKFLYDGMSLVK